MYVVKFQQRVDIASVQYWLPCHKVGGKVAACVLCVNPLYLCNAFDRCCCANLFYIQEGVVRRILFSWQQTGSMLSLARAAQGEGHIIIVLLMSVPNKQTALC